MGLSSTRGIQTKCVCNSVKNELMLPGSNQRLLRRPIGMRRQSRHKNSGAASRIDLNSQPKPGALLLSTLRPWVCTLMDRWSFPPGPKMPFDFSSGPCYNTALKWDSLWPNIVAKLTFMEINDKWMHCASWRNMSYLYLCQQWLDSFIPIKHGLNWFGSIAMALLNSVNPIDLPATDNLSLITVMITITWLISGQNSN